MGKGKSYREQLKKLNKPKKKVKTTTKTAPKAETTEEATGE